MAKTASPAKAGTTKRKRAAAKPKSKAAKPPRAAGANRRKGSDRRSSDLTAADALFKLLESPLVADLLAVGATAALAAITESRHSRRTGTDAKSSKMVKAAAKAAAAAIGRRLTTEFEEIRKASASNTSKGSAKA